MKEGAFGLYVGDRVLVEREDDGKLAITAKLKRKGMKETERIVRAYEEAIKEVLQAMSNAFIGKEPDKQTRARRKRVAARLDRIRRRYLPKEEN